eukprot:scaffold2570_cov72-Phaeocystis_antarctica.AAC.2
MVLDALVKTSTHSRGLVQRLAKGWRRVICDGPHVGRNDRPPAPGFAMPVTARSCGHHLNASQRTDLVSRVGIVGQRSIHRCLQVLGPRLVHLPAHVSAESPRPAPRQARGRLWPSQRSLESCKCLRAARPGAADCPACSFQRVSVGPRCAIVAIGSVREATNARQE